MQLTSHDMQRYAPGFLAGAIASASLWDFRIYDIRIFDALAAALLLAYLFLIRTPASAWIEQRKRFLILFIVIFSYAAAGYVLHHHRSSLAIIALSFIGLGLAGSDDKAPAWNALRWLIVIHIAVFLIQFIAYYFFGALLDPHVIFGNTSRIIRSLTEIRASGLFQEPNSYCLNMFVLTNLYVLRHPNRILVLIIATTMMISQSLWGIAAALLLIALNEFRQQTNIRRFIAAAVFAAIIPIIVFNLYLWMSKPPSDEQPYLYSRIIEIAKDPSLQERYIANRCLAGERRANGETAAQSIVRNAFGEGLTTKYFLECLPANGFAFLYKSFGLFGLIALGIGLHLAMRGVMLRDKIFIYGSLAFAFTSYPLVTYVILWIWLPLLFVSARRLPENHSIADHARA